MTHFLHHDFHVLVQFNYSRAMALGAITALVYLDIWIITLCASRKGCRRQVIKQALDSSSPHLPPSRYYPSSSIDDRIDIRYTMNFHRYHMIIYSNSYLFSMLLLIYSRTERASGIHLSVHGGGRRGRGSRHRVNSHWKRGLAASQPASSGIINRPLSSHLFLV